MMGFTDNHLFVRESTIFRSVFGIPNMQRPVKTMAKTGGPSLPCTFVKHDIIQLTALVRLAHRGVFLFICNAL